MLPIRIPPLRLRREDIPSLVQYFVERKSREMNLARVPSLDARDLERLRGYDWPGNVRELQNAVERALILAPEGRLYFDELGGSSPTPSPSRPQRSTAAVATGTMDEAIAAHIRAVLETTGGQVAGPGGAAEVLDMNPSTLRFRMKKLGIRAGGAGRSRAGG